MSARIHYESSADGIPNNVIGTGTPNQVAKWIAPHTLADSLITDNGTSVWNNGGGLIASNTAFGQNALDSNTTGTDNTGGGGDHTHPFSFSSGSGTFSGNAINLAVQYIDVIRATAN